jgi:DNA polymerase I-like protein with 3'-5' exonuclease and polymerase domains
VLESLRDAPGVVGELVAAVLEYRHHDTVIGTFLTPYQQLVTQGDGRVRPTVYTLGTDTGRMSCVRPNLQQLPRQGGIRACITADPGYVLVSADFTGVELRVAAALSGDATLRRMIIDGVDIHGLIARQVFGPQATKADRYAVKRGVFGRLYGGGVPTLAAQVGCSQETAAVMVATLDQMTPQLTRWAARLRRGVSTGQTAFRTYSGAVVGLPRGYPHKAPNYAIQRTARELLVDALLRWQRTRWGDAVCLPVHDEIVVMVPETDATAASEALVECMRTELDGVPILAQASEPSYAWADAA